MSIRLTFLGAAGTVTGSKYLLETGRSRVLIDCGLFQGLKELRLRNWAEPEYNPGSLNAVLLSHAHLDHSGGLPLLIRQGYRKDIYCSSATADLCDVLLKDSGHIQEEDAKHANRKGYSKHHPALPLYTKDDAEKALRQFRRKDFGEWFDVADDVRARFSRAGHILGASCVHLEVGGQRIVFSGDVGRPNDPIMGPPEPIERADALIVESTYGNRQHATDDPADELAEVVNSTAKKQGVVLIPAFAVGRAQSVLGMLSLLKQDGRIPDIPVYLNSPMAINATELFCRHPHDHKLTEEQCRSLCATAEYVRSAEDSKALNLRKGPMVIISASGMATGGRVLHHIKRFAPDSRNTLLFTGYQAAGTRGRSIVDGADSVKLHGRYVPIKARVEMLDGLSAHADGDELVEWLRASNLAPRQVFVTHGEPAASHTFRTRLVDEFGWDACVPSPGESVELTEAQNRSAT